MYSLYDITRGCHNLGPNDAFDVKENRVREKFDLMNQMDVYDGMSPECTDDMNGLPAYQMGNHQETSSYKMAAQQRMPANDTYLNDTPSYSQPMPGQKSIDEGISTHFLDAPSYDELPSQPIVTDGVVSSYHTGASQEVVKTDQVATREWMSVYQMGVNERMPSTQMGTHGMSQGTKRMPIHQMGTHRTMTTYQMGTHGTMTSCQMGPHGTTPTPLVDAQGTVLMSNQGAMLTQQMGTHGTIDAHEMPVSRTKHACRCSCHVTQSSPSHFPAFGLKNQRPSVIMVPQRWKNIVSDEPSKDDSESSDADDDEEQKQNYFRKNIDGTTAKFKLSKEDWGRIPINTFPSGGRLLSGDWTQIFLSKVKESNPWCSLRFKNNHVRSENSRKIHSAVFFRGGAECKRPECNVKVRFVIRKEMGRHVDVTYVGNVCHNSQPGGSDVTNDKRRNKRVRRARYPSC